MRFSRLVLAVATLSLAGCGLTPRKMISEATCLWPFGHKKAAAGVTRTKNLQVTMKLSPLPLKLADTRQLNVQLRLANISNRFIQLEFPTTQRFEILVNDATGKLVTQWSEERTFEPNVGVVGINPGEHLEYDTTIATRDMKPGQKYTVVGFFPNFEQLKAQEVITPSL